MGASQIVLVHGKAGAKIHEDGGCAEQSEMRIGGREEGEGRPPGISGKFHYILICQ
jgi:hypothetical protein